MADISMIELASAQCNECEELKLTTAIGPRGRKVPVCLDCLTCLDAKSARLRRPATSDTAYRALECLTRHTASSLAPLDPSLLPAELRGAARLLGLDPILVVGIVRSRRADADEDTSDETDASDDRILAA